MILSHFSSSVIWQIEKPTCKKVGFCSIGAVFYEPVLWKTCCAPVSWIGFYSSVVICFYTGTSYAWMFICSFVRWLLHFFGRGYSFLVALCLSSRGCSFVRWLLRFFGRGYSLHEVLRLFRFGCSFVRRYCTFSVKETGLSANFCAFSVGVAVFHHILRIRS